MSKYKIGDIIKAKVTGIASYGFFVQVDNSYNGLCHISEVSNDFVQDIHNYVHENEEIYVQVLEINEENQNMKVSIKDIYYKTEIDDKHIVESRKGFLSLKEMLPTWIDIKMNEYNKNLEN